MTDIIENAAVVLPGAVVHGWVAIEDGLIAEVGEGRAPERGLDVNGDLLLPGLVELHTDHLESHFVPRPKVRWHALGAVLAYDAQIAASGITTVFDSLRAGSDVDGSIAADLFALAEAIDTGRRQDLLRADHLTHLRCETPALDVVDQVTAFAERFPVALLSLMDHTPGQRQFRDVEKYFNYARRTGKGMDEVRAQAQRRMAEGPPIAAANRPALVALARRRRIPLASHDDTTLDDAAAAVAEGAVIAEFPTTMEAAAAVHGHGLAIEMGAPNLLRGGSHSGNVSAEAMAAAGLLRILSSDYVPGSLLMAALDLPRRVPAITLPQAVACVSTNPAAITGLHDRGRIVAGLRADLVRVQRAGDVPVVRRVWRAGVQVA